MMPVTAIDGGDALARVVRARIRDIPDFPKPGIVFKDLTPLLADATAFGAVVERLAERFAHAEAEVVVGIEARGFMFAAPVALRLGCGFVPARKPGKLPYHTVRQTYQLEYGTDGLEAHEDALRPGQRVLLLDDVLATGGTAAAAARLIRQLGGDLVGAAFVVELGFLHGRRQLDDVDVFSVVSY